MSEDGDDQQRYGLAIPESVSEWTGPAPVIVLVHGYNAKPQSLDPLRQLIERSGFSCIDFAYPNDGPIAESGELLHNELNRLHTLAPDVEVALVAHSMGGLVARTAIERENSAGNVNQLIMIAPPNHGSNLARLPIGLDVWEHFVRSRDRSCDRFLALSTSDGFCEARSDLAPGSLFLAELNKRPRNPDVEYTIFLGTAGRLSSDEQSDFATRWERLTKRNRAAAFVNPRVEPLLTGTELTEGTGDGVVSIESGRLDGVKDIALLPFAHDVVVHDLKTDVGEDLTEAIIERLNANWSE